MVIIVEENKDGFCLAYQSDTLEAQNRWRTFTAKLLEIFLQSKETILITDEPQSYSFITSLDTPSWYAKHKGNSYAITRINNVNNIIADIVHDEEFYRGLLWICQFHSSMVVFQEDSITKELVTSKNNNTTLLNTIFAVNDGASLFYKGEKTSFSNAIDTAKTILNIELVKL